MEAIAKSTVKNIEISAVIIRANGDIEDLGVIVEQKQNLLRRLLSKVINRL